MKLLVLYVFHELNNRVNTFIKDAIFLDPDIDFLFINNGSKEEPVLPDHVIYFKTNNDGYDFGGWSKALLYNNLYKDYDSFIFVNSSAMGPYLPSYFKGKWTDIYLDGLTEDVKLFGSTINTQLANSLDDPEKYSHIQSYIFSMNLETLTFLISKEIFTITSFSKSFNHAFLNKELKMSRLIIENGWNIGCLMKYYNGVDFRFLASRISDYKPFLGEVMLAKNFSDKLFNNFFELVFIKGNSFDFNLDGIKL
uniref:Glycosyltransferase n=1 Tax=viral metagenome TaxID=1070528 RepID=A0A6C0DLC3_9ZZZZ